MRYFIVFILLFTCSINIFSQDINKLLFEFNEQYYYRGIFEKDFNFSLRFVFPPPDDNSFGFIDASIGISYGVIPEYYYIGIAADAALGFDWFALFSDSKDRRNYNENYQSQLGVSLGGRIFNLLQIRNFRIWSFIGCDFMYIVVPMPYVGGELSFKIFGLEYAYYLPIFEEVPTRHQISIKFHVHIF